MPRPVVLLLVAVLAVPGALSAQEDAPRAEARLVPGDVVRINIWREPDLTGEFLVQEDGNPLLEMADERQEIQVEARCWCGARATHNARLVDGVQVYEGDLKVLGDTVELGEHDQQHLPVGPDISYELLCRRHWLKGEVRG